MKIHSLFAFNLLFYIDKDLKLWYYCNAFADVDVSEFTSLRCRLRWKRVDFVECFLLTLYAGVADEPEGEARTLVFLCISEQSESMRQTARSASNPR